MMQVQFRTIYLKKRFPLRISRGVYEGGENLFVSVTEDGVTGWGEMAPGETEGAGTPEAGRQQLEAFCKEGLSPSIHDTWQATRATGVAPCAMAALDIALWDLRAKQAG